ncbi:MAG TPA: hypothetical protein VNQ52_03975 [Microbacteriaceae bacterium]|nr:hypothetical protein [Microbacteriaceae bacterium]
MRDGRRRGTRLATIAAAAAATAGLVLAPAIPAMAFAPVELGGSACGSPISFIRTASTGITNHNRDWVQRAQWNNGTIIIYRKSNHPGTFSQSSVTSIEPAYLDVVQKGCGEGPLI